MATVFRRVTGSFVAPLDDLAALVIQPHQIAAVSRPRRPTVRLAAKVKPRRSEREIHDLLRRAAGA